MLVQPQEVEVVEVAAVEEEVVEWEEVVDSGFETGQYHTSLICFDTHMYVWYNSTLSLSTTVAAQEKILLFTVILHCAGIDQSRCSNWPELHVLYLIYKKQKSA